MKRGGGACSTAAIAKAPCDDPSNHNMERPCSCHPLRPTGYVLIGQFQNAVQMLFSFSASAINNGVTKYTAEFEGDEAKQNLLWSTALRIVLTTSLVTAAAVALFHRSLAEHFLGDV